MIGEGFPWEGVWIALNWIGSEERGFVDVGEGFGRLGHVSVPLKPEGKVHG